MAHVDEKTRYDSDSAAIASSTAKRAADVVAVVLHRIAHRFADVEEGGKVHHGPDSVLTQRPAHGGDVGDVALDELADT